MKKIYFALSTNDIESSVKEYSSRMGSGRKQITEYQTRGVHTGSLDHPNASTIIKKRGFSLYDTVHE